MSVQEPFDAGWLSIEDGNELYWEQCGNPTGIPVLIVHGGPGSGCSTAMREWFDSHLARSILFDQRNCGRSRPHASDPAVALTKNTTGSLVADIESLRSFLGIDEWIVAGISWGTTLSLAYAEEWPNRVRGLLLVSLVTTSVDEVEWLTRGLANEYPDHWRTFVEVLPEGRRDGSIAAAFAELLDGTDGAAREKAAQAWCEWEDIIVSGNPDWRPNPRYQDPRFRLGFARLVTHYFAHAGFLPEGALLDSLPLLAGTPGVILEGAHDAVSQWNRAESVHEGWPDSELWTDEASGHGASLAEIQRAGRHLIRRVMERRD
jgi:proline iminopeptidase